MTAKIRKTINTHLQTVYGELTKAEMYREHGIRFSFVKAEKSFKLEGFGITNQVAKTTLLEFVNQVKILPLTVEPHSEGEIEYKQDKKNQGVVASRLYYIEEAPVEETVETTNDKETVEVEKPARTNKRDIKFKLDEDTDLSQYAFLMHVRNYNKREDGNLHTVSFEHTELERMTAIVNAADNRGGYQLVIECRHLTEKDAPTMVVVKRYSAKKYALAQFLIEEAPVEETVETTNEGTE